MQCRPVNTADISAIDEADINLRGRGPSQIRRQQQQGIGHVCHVQTRSDSFVAVVPSGRGWLFDGFVEVASATKEEEEEERGKSKGGGIPFLFHFAVVPACQDLLEPLPLSVNPRK
jgi:hypothetical protein